jgi:hypothetical protein
MSHTSGQFIRNCAAALLLVLADLFPTTLRAAPPVQAWVQRYPGAGGAKIAMGPDGNVVVAGNIGSYGPGLVIKYSSSGLALWTNFWRGPWTSWVEDMAVGTNGNIYVTGYASEMKSAPNYQTIAYSGAGTPLWTNFYGGLASYGDVATGVDVDASGNVYVTGRSDTGKPYAPDYATVAYSSAGAPLWTNRYPAYVGDCPAAIRVDNFGHVYVSGSTPVEAGGSAFCTIAYSNAGVALWTNNFFSFHGARAIALDRLGHVYVTGDCMATASLSSRGTLLWLQQYSFVAHANSLSVGTDDNVYVTGYSLWGSTGYDYLTIAYSNTGTPLWTNRYDGPGHTNDYAQALAIGADGSVFVTGYAWGAGSFYDYLTIAYASNGVPLWTNRYNGPANGYDQAYAMAVDAGGNIYITGYSQGDCTTIKLVPAPSIRFSAIDLVSGPACRLTIAAPTNLVFRLEASTNLSDWLTLTNYSNLPFSSIQYTDPLVPDFPRRYYRTAWAP